MKFNALDHNTIDSSSAITLKLLNAVEADSYITQRTVAKEMGVALGLANAYIKRCVKKGLIKIHQVPTNRYSYYLTPRGFAEKSRLTAEFFTQGFQFFRVARANFEEIFTECVNSGNIRVALNGLTDLCEIAVMEARRHPLTIVAIVDPSSEKLEFDGIPVVRTHRDSRKPDVIVLTDIGDPQRSFEALRQELDTSQILTPSILNISRDVVVSKDEI